jgi:peptidoglycan hydrolase-like protein with peptidoglycan-binding domain
MVDREVEMNSSRGSIFALFAVLVMVLAYASGATAQSRYDAMQDFGPGQGRPMITLIQEKLTGLGYPVPVTGTMNYRTVAAIRLYQQNTGMPVTGRADQALANELNFGQRVPNRATATVHPRLPVIVAPPQPPRQTAVDDGSPQVRWVQEKLTAAGYAPGAADGMAGRRTTEAINRFRRDKGLPPGSIDMGLIDALNGV